MLARGRKTLVTLLTKVRVIHDRRPRAFLAVAVLASCLIFASYSMLRQLAFWTTYYDLGLYANSLWRTTHGYDSLESLIFPSSPAHINHLSPVLALFALVYGLVPDPMTLLLIQAVALATCTIPFYYLALRGSGNPRVAILGVGMFLVNPALHGIVRYDFHVEAFMPLFVFLLYYARWERKVWLYYVSLALMLATIEFSAVLGLAIALSFWLEKKQIDKHTLLTGIASGGLLVFILLSTTGLLAPLLGWPPNWLSRQLAGTSSGEPSDYLQRFLEILNPVSVANSLWHDLGLKLLYLTIVFAPAGLAPVKFPTRILPALPWTAILLTSTRTPFYLVDYQYSSFLLPFVFITAIPFHARIVGARKIRRLVAISLVFTLIFSSLVLYSSGPNIGWPTPSPLRSTIEQIRSMIPVNSTVLTQNDLFPQVSDFPHVTMNYTSLSAPQFILANKNSFWYDWSDPRLGYPLSIHKQIDQLTATCSYSLIISNLGLMLFRLENRCNRLS